MTQNDFLAGKKFCLREAHTVFWFCPKEKTKGELKTRISKYSIIEIDRQGFCVNKFGDLERIEFLNCEIIEDDKE